ncbi:hypothetical protein C6P45_002311 [Maudiozyma exigua]|uniref:Uncharacterized protein n=1 Tax=Maudiozyma exigua TaxID=34358 RepID=A0A9P6VWP5_MAUEX|nr:hypothetical protein C6P45_002311 [Kazachstania exigua]
MAVTRGSRSQSENTSRVSQSSVRSGSNRSMTETNPDGTMDVGNSNIEISQSGIHQLSQLDTDRGNDTYITGSDRNSSTFNGNNSMKRKRTRTHQDSYDDNDNGDDERYNDTSYFDETMDESFDQSDLNHNYQSRRKHTKKRGKLHSLFNSIKSFFFTAETPDNTNRRKLRKKRKYYSRHPNSRHLHSRKGLNRKSSNNYNNTLRETVLERERQNRNMIQNGNNFSNPRDLQRQRQLSMTNDTLSNRVTLLQRQLRVANEDLKFAKEKNVLFEKLLDDANIDRSYVKSRRDIRNLEKHNIKPQDELPPSPERKVNPLVTSSPIHRLNNNDQTDSTKLNLAPPKINFYSKYPTIPQTESLAMGNSKSLQTDEEPDNK